MTSYCSQNVPSPGSLHPTIQRILDEEASTWLYNTVTEAARTDGWILFFVPLASSFPRRTVEQALDGTMQEFTRTMYRTMYYLVTYDLIRGDIWYVAKGVCPRKSKPISPRPEDLEENPYVSWQDMPPKLLRLLQAQLRRCLKIDRNIAWGNGTPLRCAQYQDAHGRLATWSANTIMKKIKQYAQQLSFQYPENQ